MTREEAKRIYIEEKAYKRGYEDAKKELDRPHGEWEFIGDNLFKCTHCGYVADADYLRKWKVHTYDAEFPIACLNCGADMREGEKE